MYIMVQYTSVVVKEETLTHPDAWCLNADTYHSSPLCHSFLKETRLTPYDFALLLPVAIVAVVLVILGGFLFNIAAIAKLPNVGCRHPPLLD